MIALRTEAACGSCPLSLICLLGKQLTTIGVEDTRKYRFALCTRCSCVFFKFEEDTYICGRMRFGDHWPRSYAAFEMINPPWQDDFEDDDVRLGFDMVKHIFGAQPPKAKGCAESLPRYHTLQEGYLAPSVEGRRTEITRFNNRLDERDCFYHFRGSITETI